jgi:hypothetical protein
LTIIEPKRGVVAALDEETEPLFEPAWAELSRQMRGAANTVIVLLPWREPPEKKARPDGAVGSFLCSRRTFERLPRVPAEKLCFELLSAILKGTIDADRLLVRQLPLPAAAANPAPGPAAVIMAHRGSRRHLEVALRYLERAQRPGIRCRVGLDERSVARYASLIRSHREVEFVQFAAAPVGPYVVRQELAGRSREPRLVFHDSDDISCTDRFPALHGEMRRTGSQMVGCHQLMVDECDGQVTATRFPLDVSGALRRYAVHALWHPTAMVDRRHFFDAGGFSQERAIANDTQFLLRAYFSMKIRNADAFLYIRRRHPAALTVRPKTALDCPERQRLSDLWQADFEAVKSGAKALGDSSLRPFPARRGYQAIPVEAHG